MEPQIRKIISQQNAASGLQITLSGVKEIVRARALVREMTKRIGFTMVNQARFVTAVSEIARAQFERFDCVVLQIFDEGNTKWHRMSVVFEAEASELERFKRVLLFEGVSGGGGDSSWRREFGDRNSSFYGARESIYRNCHGEITRRCVVAVATHGGADLYWGGEDQRQVFVGKREEHEGTEGSREGSGSQNSSSISADSRGAYDFA